MSVRSATQSKAPTLVTSEALVAFSRCQREAYLLMFTNQQGKPHDYSLILEQRQEDVQRAFLASLEERFPHATRGENLKQAPQLAVNGILQTASYCAHYGLLTKIEDSSKLGNYHYEPTVFAGTHKPGREHRLELLFLGKVLEQLQGKSPAFGAIVGASSKPKRVRIAGKGTELPALLGDLHAWITQPPPEAPPVILNGHCPVCRFRRECATAADRDDSIGAMRGVTKKLLDRYGRKGSSLSSSSRFSTDPRGDQNAVNHRWYVSSSCRRSRYEPTKSTYRSDPISPVNPRNCSLISKAIQTATTIICSDC